MIVAEKTWQPACMEKHSRAFWQTIVARCADQARHGAPGVCRVKDNAFHPSGQIYRFSCRLRKVFVSGTDLLLINAQRTAGKAHLADEACDGGSRIFDSSRVNTEYALRPNRCDQASHRPPGTYCHGDAPQIRYLLE